ncbi:hypothetical protein [Thiohalomonas denitrificans]|uniref:hypothetical protein n=1 Tax=Thiohalomonas denitrificans TaxID=415747 RepID=UPI0026EF724A|nr:hypothetical protein [Thiohalomonas denitrificans]
MRADQPFRLTITPDGIDAFCERLRRSSATARRAVAGLAALQTFLAETAGSGDKASSTYPAIRDRIAGHLEAASQAVIDQAANSLVEAVQQRDPAAVAAVHRNLSRSGFHQALGRAETSGSFGAATPAAWAIKWCSEAERRAEAASGYPDAFDFSTAGISLEQYTAMRDLCESGR